MNSKSMKKISEYGPLVIGVAAIAAAALLAAVPTAMKRNAVSPASYVVENDYPHAMAMTKRAGCGLYIDGSFVAAAGTAEELEKAVDVVAGELAAAQSAESDTYSVRSTVEYVDGEFLDSELTEDIESAVRASSFSVYGVVTKSITSTLDAATVYVDNTDLTEGREKVLVEGEDGVIDEVYNFYYSDGKLCESVLVSSEVKVEPVSNVIERGVKLSSDKKLTSLAIFIMPYDGGISSEYGTRYLFGDSFHRGLDIAGKIPGASCYGDPVSASGDGVVVEAGYHGGYGNLVVIEHSNGIRTYYAHMSKIVVTAGQTVAQGEQIGNIGATGQADGAHVHFEVKLPDANGVYYNVDPKYYIIDYSTYLRW